MGVKAEREATTTRYRITSQKHPHYGESGYFTGKVITVVSTPMAEMRLENCRHGTDGCFVKRGDFAVDSLQPRRG